MHKKHLLTVLTIALTVCSFASADEPRKNILFIGVDDLRVELGCYGAEHMKTPNIDKLSRDGLLFEKAYVQQAICAASRISLMTGMRPDSTGVYDLKHPLHKTLPDAMSMPRFFKENGYRTISLGKIYHHSNDDKKFWDVRDTCGTSAYANPKTAAEISLLRKEAKKKGLKDKEFRHYTKGPAFENFDVPDSTYSDGIAADRAIEELQKKDDRPFFLAVGFKKPHLPFVAPKKYWDMYDPTEIEIPGNTPPQNAAGLATTTWGELRAYKDMPAKEDCTEDQTRVLTHGYRACVSYIDAQIGRVLEELDKQGLRENTIIVLWSDHGFKLGEYGDWCKHTNFELDTRVPLIYSGPGIPEGKRSSALVEYVDIYPTLAQWCGLSIPVHCEGVSSMPLFADPTLPGKNAALSQYPRQGHMGYSIRSGKWRFTQWRQRRTGKTVAFELYDHSESDIATQNVAGDSANKETVEKMEALLNAIIDK